MKKTIHIFVLILAGLISAGAVFCTEDTEYSGAIPGTWNQSMLLSSSCDSSEAYVRYNLAFTAPSSSVIGIPQNSGPAGQIRTGNWHQGHQRNGSRFPAAIKNGKLTGMPPIHSFQFQINLFPSGKRSCYHHLISLRKLVI